MTSARADDADSAPADTSDREILVTRVFDAPRALVFEAWTDPKHLRAWWGPNGFTTHHPRNGIQTRRHWRSSCTVPTAAITKTRTCMSKSSKPERLVYRHVSAPHFQMTVTFADDGGETRLTARMLFESAELRDQDDQGSRRRRRIEADARTPRRICDPAKESSDDFQHRSYGWRSRTHHHPHLRRAPPAGFLRVVYTQTSDALVRAQQLHRAGVRDGLPRRRKFQACMRAFGRTIG